MSEVCIVLLRDYIFFILSSSSTSLFREISMHQLFKHGHNWRASPDLWPLRIKQGRTRTNENKTQKSCPHMPWNNSQLEKNLR